MGAWLEAELSKIIRAPGGTRTLVAALRVRCLAARSPVLVPMRNLERETQFEWPFRSSSRRPSSAEVGPVGIEPTSSGLRDRCITVSATVPIQSARWELNPRPASYKDAALTVELRASESRAGGTRTHTCRIKSPVCCQLHHNPILGWAYAFVASWQHRVYLSC